MRDVVVVFEGASVCWCGPGVVPVISVFQVLVGERCTTVVVRALHMGTHILPPVCHHRGLLYVCW